MRANWIQERNETESGTFNQREMYGYTFEAKYSYMSTSLLTLNKFHIN